MALKDTSPKPRAGTVRKARQLRKAMTLPEVLLWRELRKRPAGLKFRRQHASGPYVLDFYCSDARLCVEVDGEAHGHPDRRLKDAERDAWLARAGIETLRIPARDALAGPKAVSESLVRLAIDRLPLHHPLRGRSPSPSELGED